MPKASKHNYLLNYQLKYIPLPEEKRTNSFAFICDISKFKTAQLE